MAPVAVEAEVGGLLIEVPFPDHHAVILIPEMLGEGGSTGEGRSAGLVTVEAGEERDAGGVALGGVVKLGEAESVLGELVQVGSRDFRAVAADVGEAEVIGHDHDDVGAG